MGNDVWSKIKKIRGVKHTQSKEYIEMIFDNFLELHGDKINGDDGAIVSGIAMLNNIPVTIIAHQKGNTIEERIKRNFGMATSSGYRKALRMMKQAEKFNRPIITFIDTPGAFCGLSGEADGEAISIANCLFEMSSISVPIVSIIIGEASSGGALGIGMGDRVYMMENSIYSIASPEAFATILWKDASRASEAAEIMKITAYDMKKLNIVDRVIEEVQDKAQIKSFLQADLEELMAMPKEKLVGSRYLRYRNIP